MDGRVIGSGGQAVTQEAKKREGEVVFHADHMQMVQSWSCHLKASVRSVQWLKILLEQQREPVEGQQTLLVLCAGGYRYAEVN